MPISELLKEGLTTYQDYAKVEEDLLRENNIGAIKILNKMRQKLLLGLMSILLDVHDTVSQNELLDFEIIISNMIKYN